MKKIIFITFFVYLLIPHFAFSAEDVNQFQQEIIMAKQKQGIIAQKVQNVKLTIDQQKNQELRNEAEELMEGLVEKKAEKTYQPIEFKMPARKIPVKSDAQGDWVTAIDRLGKPIQSAFSWMSAKQKTYREKSLTEGEVLYKVAVSDGKITLREAIGIGLANNLEVQALKKKVEVAQAKLAEAKRALFPTISMVLEENGGKLGGSEDNPSGRIYRGRNYKLNLTQPIFYGGELTYTLKQAETNLKGSKEEYYKAKNEYILQTKQAYYGVVKAEYNVLYQGELYERISNFYKKARQEKELKLMSEIDYLNIESKFNETLLSLESSKYDLLSATLLLYQTLVLDTEGYPLPLDLRIHYVKVKPDLDQVLEMALQANPNVRVKRLALESAEYGVLVYKAKKLPKVDLRGSYGMLGEVFKDSEAIEDDNHDLDLEKEWFLGTTISMPLGPNTVEYNRIKHKYGPTVLALHGSEDWSHKLSLSLFDKLSEITDEKSAEASVLQARSDLQKAENEVISKVREDFYNVQKALLQIEVAVSKLRYQSKQDAILLYMVKLQEASIESLLEHYTESTQHKFSFIQAVTDYNLALDGLGVSIGDPYYFEVSAKS
jgi:outer membrane protein TolC